jgi:hypothetical protein
LEIEKTLAVWHEKSGRQNENTKTGRRIDSRDLFLWESHKQERPDAVFGDRTLGSWPSTAFAERLQITKTEWTLSSAS